MGSKGGDYYNALGLDIYGVTLFSRLPQSFVIRPQH